MDTNSVSQQSEVSHSSTFAPRSEAWKACDDDDNPGDRDSGNPYELPPADPAELNEPSTDSSALRASLRAARKAILLEEEPSRDSRVRVNDPTERQWNKRLEVWARNHAVNATMYIFVACVGVIMFVWGVDYHARADETVGFRAVRSIAKGSGRLISFLLAVLVFTACKFWITKLRATKLNTWFPFDALPELHRVLAFTVLGFSAVHAVAHVVNICLTKGWITMGVVWSGDGQGGLQLLITGVIAVLLISTMVVSSSKYVRGTSFGFRIFSRAHVPLFSLTLATLVFHCTLATAIFVVFPLTAYAFDVVSRKFWRRRAGLAIIRCDPHEDERTIRLEIERPNGFVFKAGQYAELKIPCLSQTEFHPFTMASAPVDKTLVFIIEAKGRWTNALLEFAKGTLPGVPPRPSVTIRGPHGAPTQLHDGYRNVLLIASGSGISPMISVYNHLMNSKASSCDVSSATGSTRIHSERLGKFAAYDAQVVADNLSQRAPDTSSERTAPATSFVSADTGGAPRLAEVRQLSMTSSRYLDVTGAPRLVEVKGSSMSQSQTRYSGKFSTIAGGRNLSDASFRRDDRLFSFGSWKGSRSLNGRNGTGSDAPSVTDRDSVVDMATVEEFEQERLREYQSVRLSVSHLAGITGARRVSSVAGIPTGRRSEPDEEAPRASYQSGRVPFGPGRRQELPAFEASLIDWVRGLPVNLFFSWIAVGSATLWACVRLVNPSDEVATFVVLSLAAIQVPFSITVFVLSIGEFRGVYARTMFFLWDLASALSMLAALVLAAACVVLNYKMMPLNIVSQVVFAVASALSFARIFYLIYKSAAPTDVLMSRSRPFWTIWTCGPSSSDPKNVEQGDLVWVTRKLNRAKWQVSELDRRRRKIPDSWSTTFYLSQEKERVVDEYEQTRPVDRKTALRIGRPNWIDILETALDKCHTHGDGRPLGVFFCGSPAVGADIKAAAFEVELNHDRSAGKDLLAGRQCLCRIIVHEENFG